MQQMECHQPAAKHPAAMEWWKIRTYGVQLKFKHHFERYQLKTFSIHMINTRTSHTHNFFFITQPKPKKKNKKHLPIKLIRLITSPHLKQRQHISTANQKYTNTNKQRKTNWKSTNQKNQKTKQTKINSLTTEIIKHLNITQNYPNWLPVSVTRKMQKHVFLQKNL